jgi:dihydroneopterin aldolase/2-amino-4-hydroxy-6-hydroxymethyldihydropteridine diphosphokinase/dihydropteroate synthase
VDAIIGMNPWERLEKQSLRITVSANTSPTEHWNKLSRQIKCVVGESKFKTLEALTFSLLLYCYAHYDMENVRVCVEKPSAIMRADCAAVEIQRQRNDLPKLFSHLMSLQDLLCAYKNYVEAKSSFTTESIAFVALGSNFGGRALMLNNALRKIDSSVHSRVLETSFLYETEPEGVIEQPMFLNAACKVC